MLRLVRTAVAGACVWAYWIMFLEPTLAFMYRIGQGMNTLLGN